MKKELKAVLILLSLLSLFMIISLFPLTAAVVDGSISIACGSSSAVGGFQADQSYSGGSTYRNNNTVDISQITSNPPPAALFNNERYGAMSYTIPGFTSGNSYTVTLYFAETYLTSSGRRLFNVSINGATALSNFDIYASAGGQNKAIARSFTTTANASGQIVIQFTNGTENAKINGISIQPSGSNPTPTPTRVINTPTTGPTPTPTRVVGPTPTPGSGSISIASGSSSAVGSFQADQYYSGGSTYSNSNTVDVSQITSNPPPAALFNNERYGTCSYTIPGFTSGSSYAVTLYFAETYLTSSGNRLFSVSINGATALSNFDIYATAGGQNKAIARSFTTTANASGQIVIQFTNGSKDNAKINGISIKSGNAPTNPPTPTPTRGVGPTPTPTRGATPTPTPGGNIVADGYAAGTTGGAGGTVVTVTNASDLSRYATASGSYIINVSGNMGDIGDIKVASNKTIQGVGTTAKITGEFSVDGTSNVIFKNLTITHPGAAGAGNGIDVLNSAKNVFITKCYFYDVADECIGVTKQADYVTVSWCKFDYPSQVDHNFSVLVGSDDALTSDQGKLHVTFHHNWWSTGSDERMPSVRFGTVHCYNNYYNCPNNGYCIRVRLYSQVLAENNYFENVKNPIEYYNTTGTNGKCKATGNVFVNTSGTNTGTDSVFTPPYGYSLDTGSNVKSIVSAGAGNR